MWNIKKPGRQRGALPLGAPSFTLCSPHPLCSLARPSRRLAAAGTAPADANATESPYLSVDPSPAAPASTPTPALRTSLLDEREKIFER